MQLSKFSDYALRTLMHLAVAQENMLTTQQIATIHNAKYNHLAKVTQWLVREGYVTSVRGRSGGLRLAKTLDEVNIGHVIRALESQSALVECLGEGGGNCILSPACGLTSALRSAQDAFYAVLDQMTLADLIQNNTPLAQMLKRLNA